MNVVLKVAVGWLALAAVLGLFLGRVFAVCGRRDSEARLESVPDRARRAGL